MAGSILPENLFEGRLQEWAALRARYSEAADAILAAREQVLEGLGLLRSAVTELKPKPKLKARERLEELAQYQQFIYDLEAEANDLDDELSAIAKRDEFFGPSDDTRASMDRIRRRNRRLVQLIQWVGLNPWRKRMERTGKKRRDVNRNAAPAAAAKRAQTIHAEFEELLKGIEQGGVDPADWKYMVKVKWQEKRPDLSQVAIAARVTRCWRRKFSTDA